MKKLFIITIMILFQSFPSFGDPNGKGIVCWCDFKCYGDEKERGWFFEEDKVTLHYFHNKNTKILIEKGNKNPPFSLTVDKILWSGYFFYELDRKSLNLKYYDNNIEIERMCFFKNNKREYLKSLEFLKQKYQKEINKKLKDNKI